MAAIKLATPCPLCGQPASVTRLHAAGGKPHYNIGCDGECGLVLYGDTGVKRAAMIGKWNRINTPQPVELVRRLRRLVVLSHSHATAGAPAGTSTGCHERCSFGSAIHDADEWLAEQEEASDG